MSGETERGNELTRAEVLRRGSAFALLAGGGAAGALAAAEDAFAVEGEPKVRLFHSRPDLRPPAVNVVRPAHGTARGLLFLAPPSGPGDRGPLIVDEKGEVVWFRSTMPDTTMDFRTGLYKGKPVLTWWEGRHHTGVGLRGSYVVADASYREIARFISRDQLRPDFHEVLLTPYDTLLATSYDPVPANLSSVGGPSSGTVYDGVVRELEIPTGRVLFEWRSLDHVRIEESYQDEIGSPYDYFHVNSVGYDSDGNLLISARNTWTVYKVDRRTGAVMWRLGGKKSDFAMGPGTAFAFQHDARSHDHGRRISVFDNGPDPNTKPRSRAIVLALDRERRRATLAREIVHAPPVFAFATGNFQMLPNGNSLVCWGVTGWLTEYGPDGKPRFDAKLPKGGQNYRVFRFPWVGRPTEPPALVVARASRKRPPRLWASWNGATDVAGWQLRAGRTTATLGLEATVGSAGFETWFGIPHRARYAQVAALDKRGRVLGVSKPVRLPR